MRFNVEEVLNVVGEALSSIDIRIVSVLIDDKWRNVVTAVRLSADTAEAVTNQLQKVIAHHELVHTPVFRIDSEVFPFTEWSSLMSALQQGKLPSSEVEIELDRPIKCSELVGNVQLAYSILRPLPQWPTLEASGNAISTPDPSRNPHNKIHSEHIQRAVSRLGYSSALDAIATLLGLNIGQTVPSFDVFVAVPILAKIRNVAISLNNDEIEATIDCDPRLSGIKVFGSLYGTSGEGRQRISFVPDRESNQLGKRGFLSKAHVTNAVAREYLELKLVHDQLGEVFSHAWPTRDLIPEQFANPLYSVLKEFCPSGTLQGLLSRPHQIRPHKTKPQNEFEQHVAWILGCFGFSTIVLGAHEHWVAKESRVSRGSVDLLAYHPNRRLLLLGACTLNVPKQEDYAQLVSMRAMLLDNWCGDVPFTCDVVMFTGVPGCSDGSDSGILEQFFSTRNNGVVVIDADRLSNAVLLLEERKEEDFLKQFASASLKND